MFKKPTVFSNEDGSHVLGKDGNIKASFTIADHGASHEGAAIAHLQQNFDNYMAECEDKQHIEVTSYRQGVKDSSNASYTPKNPLERKLTKRHKGIEIAVSKLTKEAKDSHEYDYEGEMVLNQLQQMMHHIAELKGMVKPNTNLPEWVQSKITLACDYMQTASDYLSGEMKEENGMPFEGPYRKVGERKDEYGNTVKNVAKHLAKKAMDKQTNEEAELEEKRGLWDNIHAKQKRIKNGSGEHMRKPGSEGAPTTAALKASQTENYKVAKKDMKENKILEGALKRLEEGRGRPPKEGSAAWHRQQAACAAGKPKEEPVALGMQLRKAKSINTPVMFENGEKHVVHNSHADAFENHMDARKTSQEKADFQKRASASHEAFKKAVTEPLPSSKGGGSEVVKYRH